MTTTIAGIPIPDSALAKATTEYIRDVESDLLYHHSRRVFLFGALSGERQQLTYNPELLYVGAMFHDLGLVEGYRSADERFEVDGANAAAAFLKPYGLSDDDIEQLILEVVFAAAATLPFGGTLDLTTASVTTNFILSTQLTATAAGFGALSLVTSSSLTRTISRCGGLVRTSVEAGRSNALHVILPC